MVRGTELLEFSVQITRGKDVCPVSSLITVTSTVTIIIIITVTIKASINSRAGSPCLVDASDDDCDDVCD
jgi:hypothetical protein